MTDFTIRRNRGFVLVFLLALMPVILAVVSVVIAIQLLLLMDGENNHTCRKGLLEIQETFAQACADLTRLNPLATQLRAEKVRAMKEAEAAMGSPLELLAMAHLESVIQRQLSLSKQQNRIIQVSRFRAEEKMNQIYSRISKNNATSSHPLPRLALDAVPKFDLTPSYEATPHFSEKQALRISWNADITRTFPKWITHSFPEIGTWNQQCGATIENEGHSWNPHLIADKQ